MLVLPHDSLKSQKTVSSDNGGHKYLRKCETQASIRCFTGAKMSLFQAESSNGAKIRIWSKSLGTKLLRTTGIYRNSVTT